MTDQGIEAAAEKDPLNPGSFNDFKQTRGEEFRRLLGREAPYSDLFANYTRVLGRFTRSLEANPAVQDQTPK